MDLDSSPLYGNFTAACVGLCSETLHGSHPAARWLRIPVPDIGVSGIVFREIGDGQPGCLDANCRGSLAALRGEGSAPAGVEPRRDMCRI